MRGVGQRHHGHGHGRQGAGSGGGGGGGEGVGFLRVEESGGRHTMGMVAVKGRVVGGYGEEDQGGGQRMDVLLVGEGGGGQGGKGREVRRDSMVEVRPPTWSVALDGTAWLVVADWRLR